jgi:hypothetical protein
LTADFFGSFERSVPGRSPLVLILIAVFVLPVSGTADDAGGFLLSDRCPPGFERLQDDRCRLVTLYDRYDSLQGKGVGGTQTALPERRDGFTAQQIDLGRYLFFDPLLSADGSISCASCHDPKKGFGDGRGRSVGIAGTQTRRGAPTLWNSAFLTRLFWDARRRRWRRRRPVRCMPPMKWPTAPRSSCSPCRKPGLPVALRPGLSRQRAH